MAKKTWAEKWGGNPVDYTRTSNELAKELKKVRSATTRRMAAIKRNNTFSYAAEAYQAKIKSIYMLGKMPDISSMSYQRIERELRIHHDFWSAKTSSIKGAKDTIREMSANFFGSDKRGRPRHILNESELSEVWSLYHEFQNMYKESSAKYDSYRLQTVIGAAFESEVFDPKDFAQTLKSIRSAMEVDFESEDEMSRDELIDFFRNEVFNGNGNDFNF